MADLDPLVLGLLESLPEPGAVWPVAERQKWLRAAESIFALLYKDEPNDA